MKYSFSVHEVDYSTALYMVQKYHYSNSLPAQNKYFLGFYLDNFLVGLITLGYGTRPLHTIRLLFPSLTTPDYLEIGRMCMTEDMPRNSESQMISACVHWLKAYHPEVKILFTWADGMLGKVGYVYQACSFWYAGYAETDTYLTGGGQKIHPRLMKKMFFPDDTRIGVRPILSQQKELGITHYRGRQFKYLTFLCDRKEKRRLMQECTYPLTRNYPKEGALEWRRQDEKGEWIPSSRPPYKTDNTNNQHGAEQLYLF